MSLIKAPERPRPCITSEKLQQNSLGWTSDIPGSVQYVAPRDETTPEGHAVQGGKPSELMEFGGHFPEDARKGEEGGSNRFTYVQSSVLPSYQRTKIRYKVAKPNANQCRHVGRVNPADGPLLSMVVRSALQGLHPCAGELLTWAG